MTDSQLFMLCGVILFSAAPLSNSPHLGILAIVFFLGSILTKK